ncbi:MAG: zinc ribbon domain-containing protein [Acidobacteriota bacterium]
MAETIVENQICNACGVDIRKGALFCYHCGGSVTPVIASPKVNNVVDENQVSARENNTENGKKVNRTELKSELKNESASVEEIADKLMSKPELQPETKLKSAASLRKKSKSVQKKKVEIIWEEYENAPNVWFILAAISLALFAFGILWLALYF